MLLVSKITQPLGRLLLLITVTVFSVTILSSTAHADIAGWNAGKIIDDVVFTNKSSMNVGQIQEFLNSKVPTCDTYGTNTSEFGGGTRAQWAAARGYSPPFTCLKDFSENGKSSAQIIYDTAQEFAINPQVLIVLLQKEQGLVTDTWPIPGSSQYRSATGYGCPDTAPCDSQYYGLTNQVRWSARMFRAIMNASPTWYTPYVLGSNYIRYSPTVSCGGSTVNIQNRSTQALYNYTPYQPNAGALAAGWGTAPCGAYGNRNFYLYFTGWFGPTTRNLVTTSGNGVFQVENGLKRAFPNEITFLSYGYDWSEVLSISNTEFNQLPYGSVIPYNVNYRNGQLVTTDGNSIYLIADGKKRSIPSEPVFLSNSWLWSYVRTISSGEISQIPDGVVVPYNTNYRNGQLVTADGNSLYLVAEGKKRNIPNESIFLSNSWKWSYIRTISSVEFSQIPDGTPVSYNANFRDGQLVTTDGNNIYLINDGKKRNVPNESVFLSYSWKWSYIRTISSVEFSQIPLGVPVPSKN